ncbi:MAG: PIN domain-containing protein [Deltaproteobacteria bacterium]|nr:PIN domain-containing protein [Deltaproteobacteria bacterium]
MIALDTNLLVYAHRLDLDWHGCALDIVRSCAEGKDSWAVPWPCLHEFLAVVTHRRIFKQPSTLEQALRQARAWLSSPTIVLLNETEGYFSVFERVLMESQVSGAKIHDARIAALCIAHGVSELWTADRDFSRFPGLRTRNPMVGK